MDCLHIPIKHKVSELDLNGPHILFHLIHMRPNFIQGLRQQNIHSTVQGAGALAGKPKPSCSCQQSYGGMKQVSPEQRAEQGGRGRRGS